MGSAWQEKAERRRGSGKGREGVRERWFALLSALRRGRHGRGAAGKVSAQFASRSKDETQEERGGAEGARLELGVELAGHKVAVVLELDNLHAIARFILANKTEADLFQLGSELRVDLVPAQRRKRAEKRKGGENVVGG